MLGHRTSEVRMFDESFAFPSSLLGPVPAAPRGTGGPGGPDGTGAGSGAADGGRVRGAVVGGGIAGLVTAYELQRRGFDIVVYERLDRPGGRVRTHRFWDGTYADLGAMRVPENHHCVLHYVRAFGLPTRPFVNANPDAYYHLRGHRVRIHQAGTLDSVYALGAGERGAPLDVLDGLLRAVWAALGTDQQRHLLEGRWDDPALERLATVSLWQYVHERISPDAWQLLGHASGLAHYEQSCLLEVLVDYFGLFHLGQVELVGGMDTLVQAFVRALRPGTLRVSTRIDELALTGTGVRIGGRRLGHRISELFDFAVCCVPVPALDRIDVRPALPHHQQHAVRGISYASSTKALVHTRRRSWELRDGVFGGGSFTDMPIQQCWYPSDNARPGAGGGPVNGNGAGPANGDGRRPRYRLVAVDPDRSHAPAVLTGAYLWGASARRFTTLPPADRDLLVLKCLERLHPRIRDDVDDIVHWNWDDQIGPGGGAFAHLAPGEHGRYLVGLGTPHPAADPRIWFAGEHLSAAHAWMQGAAQSALGVVLRVLERWPHRGGEQAAPARVGSRP
ncbi:flavin monoamine oxidase family protein [Kitasatospora sp. NPDC056327]|uniref:flavin monoamine oxidase family protein n=1 Tax=Kitasatospora sp. NPDC056327 TaxID=3345785 RepID=UPI0035E169E0